MEPLFTYLKRQIKIFPVLERLLAGYKIICQSLPWGRVSKEKTGKTLLPLSLFTPPAKAVTFEFLLALYYKHRS